MEHPPVDEAQPAVCQISPSGLEIQGKGLADRR